MKTEGAIDGSNVKYGEHGALDLNAKYALSVPNLSFAEATVGAETTATFVTVGGLELREVAAKTTYKGNTLEFDSTINDRGRELEATGTLIVHADHNELHLPALALRSQGIEWRLAQTDATVQFDQREIRLKDVRFVSGAQSLAVDGTIAVDRGPAKAGHYRFLN